ncbi:DUF2853 family protein [Microbacterium dextranolyticum]|uniref:DUF2853 family protein n=1 Tax=Microbacterium dextranolyticum TaxID=36806 RepID=A0A9W6M5P7_9MICO|nr:DUF2853 family protein [Microbacterium dextranolyticum]MBM7463946.1 hypothetical protein [Microbacterium dextranolyticum]GLJ95027.1 hypothetical protein GCM10017591_10890 [Microbacterium dextranolyticum]
MTDWAADVKIYRPDADDAAIEGLLKTYRLVMTNRDSAYVAFSDPTELATVKTSFLQKKLGLTDSNEVLDAALAEVGETLKADRTKSRITVYYLLAEKFGKLDLFH